MKTQCLNEKLDLMDICNRVKELLNKQEYNESEVIIRNAMQKFPHAPEPHNLFGILLEKKEDHVGAMKHFRAAWALDSTYLPARYNLENYGTFYKKGNCAFDESDCIIEPAREEIKIEYDENHVGHVIRRNKK